VLYNDLGYYFYTLLATGGIPGWRSRNPYVHRLCWKPLV